MQRQGLKQRTELMAREMHHDGRALGQPDGTLDTPVCVGGTGRAERRHHHHTITDFFFRLRAMGDKTITIGKWW